MYNRTKLPKSEYISLRHSLLDNYVVLKRIVMVGNSGKAASDSTSSPINSFITDKTIPVEKLLLLIRDIFNHNLAAIKKLEEFSEVLQMELNQCQNDPGWSPSSRTTVEKKSDAQMQRMIHQLVTVKSQSDILNSLVGSIKRKVLVKIG